MQRWIFIVLGIITLILIVALFATIKRGRNEKRLNQLNREFEKLTSTPTYKLIDSLDEMNLAGESAQSLEKWRQHYHQLLNDTFADLYQQLYDAQENNQKFAIFKAARQISDAEAGLTAAKKDAQQIDQALQRLLKSNEHNEAETERLLNQYRQMRKLILTKSFTFGPAVDALEQRLTKLDDRFDTVKKLTRAGDHLEAEKVLREIHKQLSALQDLLHRLPPRHQELIAEFPDQLTEIKTFYRKMTQKHYNFGEPSFDDALMLLHNKVQTSLDQLSKLQIDEVEHNNEQISQKIDHLYQRLQDQMTARKEVPALQKTTSEFLNHASQHTTSLLDALDHLNQSYVLTHHELETVRQMRANIDGMRRQYDQQTLAIGEKTAVDTESVALFKEINQKLTRIEEDQFKVNNNISELFESEKVAKAGVKQFVIDFKQIQRRIERLHLPGLPKDYVEYVQMVKEEIVKLEHHLDQVKINIEDITKQLIMTQEDLNTLTQKSKDLHDAAVLTEQALQYANRYTYANEDLAKAAKTARQLYDQQHEYAKALDTIATALEEIEPGSFKRIEKTYYDAADTL